MRRDLILQVQEKVARRSWGIKACFGRRSDLTTVSGGAGSGVQRGWSFGERLGRIFGSGCSVNDGECTGSDQVEFRAQEHADGGDRRSADGGVRGEGRYGALAPKLKSWEAALPPKGAPGARNWSEWAWDDGSSMRGGARRRCSSGTKPWCTGKVVLRFSVLQEVRRCCTEVQQGWRSAGVR